MKCQVPPDASSVCVSPRIRPRATRRLNVLGSMPISRAAVPKGIRSGRPSIAGRVRFCRFRDGELEILSDIASLLAVRSVRPNFGAGYVATLAVVVEVKSRHASPHRRLIQRDHTGRWHHYHLCQSSLRVAVHSKARPHLDLSGSGGRFPQLGHRPSWRRDWERLRTQSREAARLFSRSLYGMFPLRFSHTDPKPSQSRSRLCLARHLGTSGTVLRTLRQGQARSTNPAP